MVQLDFYKLEFLREELIKFMSTEYRDEFKEINKSIDREIDRLTMNSFRM